MAEQPTQQKIQIKMSDEVLKGVYANAMQIVHTQEEFIMDFLNISPHQGIGIVGSRVIVSPGHLKRMIAALEENLKRYEQQFGSIEAAKQPGDIGFQAE